LGCSKLEPKEEASESKKAIPYDAKKGMFSDFEGSDPVSWGGVSTEIVQGGECGELENGKGNMENGKVKTDNHSNPFSIVHSPSSSTNKCLKVTYPKGDFPGLSAKRLPSDWSNFGILVMDVFNPSEEVVPFGILIKDKPGGHSYPNRLDKQFAFKPGKNKFIFNITGLKTNDGKRQMDLSQIMELIVFLSQPKEPVTLYFDNIRLEHAAGSEIEGMKRFDLGTQGSEVWPGFLQVTDKTHYSEEAGYGWSYLGQADAQDRGQYPDALFRDWIRTATPFKVDVKNGQHVVYVMLEDPGAWEYYQNFKERRFYAEDVLVGEDKMTPEQFFSDHYYRHMNHEDFPGQDVFEEYVQKRFVWKRFVIDVADRQLTLKCEPNTAYACTISAIITAPLEQDDKVQQYLKLLDRQRKEFFDGQYVEKVPQFDSLDEKLVKQYQSLGFIPFVKNYDQMLYPAEPPKKSQAVDRIQIFAAQGEKEPFVIGIYPLQAGGQLHVDITDLVLNDGVKIPSDAILIRWVQYRLKRMYSGRVYSVVGDMLRTNSQVVLKKGQTRYFWFTVNVSKDARPGDYKGSVIIRENNVEVKRISVELKVLPFGLDDPDIAIGLFYTLPPQFNWYEETQNQRWTEVERQLQDMRDHGMNTLALSIMPGVKAINDSGDAELDFAFFDDFLHAYKHFGFDRPVSGYGLISVFHQIRQKTEGNPKLFAKAMENAFGQIQWHAQQIAGVDMVAGLADELSNTGGAGIDSIIPAAEVLKNAGIRATGFFNNPKDIKVFDYFSDVTVSNDIHIDQDFLSRVEKSGANLWFYNTGHDRFSFGLHLWKTKAKGKVQWHYQLPSVDPYFDLDGREGDTCASYPSPAGPINTVWFELAREGIDDYRYLKILEKMMEERKGKMDADATIERAEKFLEALRKDIPVELDKRKEIPDEFYDVTRKTAADLITELLRTP